MAGHNFTRPRVPEDSTVVTRVGAIRWTSTRYRGMVLTYLRALSKKMGAKSVREIPEERLKEVGATIYSKGMHTISIDVEIPDPATAKERLRLINNFRRKNKEFLLKVKKRGGRRNFFMCFAKGAEFTDTACMDENIMDSAGCTVVPKKSF